MLAKTVVSTRKIYVRLLDEGTNVWRPCIATKISAYEYVIVEDQIHDCSSERWEFHPGTRVRVAEKEFSPGSVRPAAVAAIQ